MSVKQVQPCSQTLFFTSVDKHYIWVSDLMIWFDLLCLTSLSAIFQLYHGDKF